MQPRSRKFHLLVGLLAGVALLSFGAARMATAETLDLSAIFTADCAGSGTVDGADLAFLADMQAGAAPAAPAAEPAAAAKACKTSATCGGKKWYCAKEVGACKGAGTCKEKPLCTQPIEDPVCGCNHKTYSSECMANAKGVNVDHKGKCEPKAAK